MAIGQELLAVPFPDMVLQMGLAISQAQQELDFVSVRMAQLMAGNDVTVEEPDPDKPGEFKTSTVKAPIVEWPDPASPDKKRKLSLLELGFTPTFYQFVDTIIEIKISIAIRTETEQRRDFEAKQGSFSSTFLGFYNKGSFAGTSVSASFASKYQYSAEGSSLLRTKLVPVPPPAVLQERIRKLLTDSPPA